MKDKNNDNIKDFQDSTKEKEKQLRFILNLSDKIRSLSNPSKIFKTITKEAKEYFNADICGYNEIQNNMIIEKLHTSTKDTSVSTNKYEWYKYSKINKILKSGKAVIVNDISKDKLLDNQLRQWSIKAGISSSIAIPLIKEDNLVGIFFVDKYKPYRWKKSDVELARDIADRAWMAVERAKNEEEKKSLLLKVDKERKRLKGIIENIDAGIWICDILGNMTLLNSNVSIDTIGEINKTPIKELIDQLEILDINGTPILEDNIPVFKALKGKTVKSENILKNTKNGEILYIGSRISPKKDKDGNIIGVIGITQEISDRKKMEEALIDSRRKGLELIRKLKKTDESRNLFLSSLSHELRNPLATLMMGLNLLQQEGQNNEIKENTIKMMSRQGDQLSRLVDDLLDMTRITQNKFELELKTIEINKLLNNIIKDNSTLIDEKGIIKKIDIQEDKIYIKGDPVRLTQAIENLIHNASKFTPKHGIISIMLKQDYIKNEVLISINDTGEGISPKLLKNIFEPFVQVKNGLGKSYAGLGIGLSIVKDVITKHNGTIEVFSKGRGWGTQFIIRLPIL